MYGVHPRSVLTSDASHASFGLRVRDPARGGRSRPTNRISVTLGNYITLVYREAEGRTDEKKPGTRLRLVLYRGWLVLLPSHRLNRCEFRPIFRKTTNRYQVVTVFLELYIRPEWVFDF